ncbi:MAG TPA: hypothetical protein DCW86_04165 [Actinobacteria bacterium]|nr:hypothetical protein [Actinomycetota bacterium]
MRVVFVYPDFGIGSKGKFYNGIAYISAVLKEHGHAVSLIHLTEAIQEGELTHLVLKSSPDLVALSSTTNMFPHVERYARAIKKGLDTPIICGGVHATLDPQSVLECEAIDMACVGEGEEAMAELCERLEKGQEINDVRNIWLRMDGGIARNPLRPLVENLDSLPFPDRDIFDYERLEDARLGRVAFMASRGCPYNCSFCSNHELKKIYPGRYVRFRSVENVIAEAKKVIKEYSPRYAVFHDDILTLNKKWLRTFTAKWAKEVDLPFSCNSRVNLLDEEVVGALKEAGCFEISMGLESGNDFVRGQVLNRKMSNEEIKNAFALCRQYGIKTVSYNMVGLPFESMTKMLDTVKLNAMVKSDNLQVSIFYPFPRTRLYDVCKEKGFLTDRRINSYFEDTVLEQPTLDKNQVRFAFQYFDVLVKIYSICYSLPRFLVKICEKVLDGIFSSRSLATIIIGYVPRKSRSSG